MTQAVEPVRWMVASRPHRCCECGEEIWPGMRFAHYVEVLARDDRGRHPRYPDDYCAECGQLLEDSLFTTEMLP